MIKYKNLVLAIFVSALIVSCSQNKREVESSQMSETSVSMDMTDIDLPENYEVSESNEATLSGNENQSTAQAKSVQQKNKSTSPNFISSLATFWQNDDDMHKFIRSAQFKFEVQDVPQATTQIENIIINNRGFILNSSIKNDRFGMTTIAISPDSTLVTEKNRISAILKLKVPYTKLDSVLRAIAPLAINVDYRVVNAQDVTLDIIAEKLKQSRLIKKQERISNAIDTKGRKLNDVLDGEDMLDAAAENADQATLAQFSLNEQIQYSVINVEIYQRETEYFDKIFVQTTIDDYKPSLGQQAINSLRNGWFALCQVFIAILNIWPLVLIIIFGVILYKKYIKKV